MTLVISSMFYVFPQQFHFVDGYQHMTLVNNVGFVIKVFENNAFNLGIELSKHH